MGTNACTVGDTGRDIGSSDDPVVLILQEQPTIANVM